MDFQDSGVTGHGHGVVHRAPYHAQAHQGGGHPPEAVEHGHHLGHLGHLHPDGRDGPEQTSQNHARDHVAIIDGLGGPEVDVEHGQRDGQEHSEASQLISMT